MCNDIKLCFHADFFSVIQGDVRETNNYVINLIILLGKGFIFKISDMDSLNITLNFGGICCMDQGRHWKTFRKVGEVYWSGGLVNSFLKGGQKNIWVKNYRKKRDKNGKKKGNFEYFWHYYCYLPLDIVITYFGL